MAGTLLLRLDGDGRAEAGDGGLDLVAALADDHHALCRAERIDGCQKVQEQRPAGDRVEHLVGVGAHPRALPGGEDDRCEAAPGGR